MKRKILKLLILALLIVIIICKVSVLISKEVDKKRITSYVRYASTYNYYYKPLIVIPKISLTATIQKAKKDFSNLDNSLVYYSCFNPSNKIVIFGHSGAGYGTYFSRLNELTYGDDAYIYYEDVCYKYQIYNIKYIDEMDLSILDNNKEEGKLYLVTCTKKDKSKRLLIELVQKTRQKPKK